MSLSTGYEFLNNIVLHLKRIEILSSEYLNPRSIKIPIASATYEFMSNSRKVNNVYRSPRRFIQLNISRTIDTEYVHTNNTFARRTVGNRY